ncbi:MAG: ABC transporter permease [Phycisphaerales bacterium]|nr:ABC transporter permease [Phycisphaerales bacterium]
MLTQILSIARNTFVEALRQPVFFVLVMLSGVIQLFNVWGSAFSMGMQESSEVQGDDKIMLDVGMGTIFVLGTLLAAFIATAVVSREIENKTVLTVVSKPVARWVMIVGKYAGIAGAILVAVLTMLLFLYFSIRHGVMSTASDNLDQPVLVFSLSAVFLAILIAGWCNFFYGWNFPQTSVVLMLPLLLVGYLLVLSLSKEWKWQPITKDFKPQITLACTCLVMAIMVLTAAATAASTRLGQVMTIVVCAGLFIATLLTDHFIGRYAFRNQTVAVIKSAAPADPARTTFQQAGDTFTVELAGPPRVDIQPGFPFYYGPNPGGFALAVPPFAAPTPERSRESGMQGPPAVIVTQVRDLKLTIRNIGERPVPVDRAPEAGDFVFAKPTSVSIPALAIWAAIPNMHHYWLLDAITQTQRIPPAHVAKVAGYALAQITGLLSIAVLLFQKRDVG